MIQKPILLILLGWFIAASLLGSNSDLNSFPAEGDRVDWGKEYTFSYHGSADDLHWYGSSQWAVLFNFDEVYPTLSMSQFAINSALIYFPVLGHNAKVELYTDHQGQPQQQVGSSEQIVTQNLMQFDFNTLVQADKIWVILTYHTSYLGPFVSASWGGGSRSYYLNQNYETPFLQSMANAGFNCEFLFALKGDFIIPNQDLELKNFALEGDMVPRANLRPQFTIYNHSNQVINNAQVQIQLNSPSAAGFSLADNIQIQEAILPQTEFVFNSNLPEYATHVYTLDNRPMQLKARAILSSELSAADMLFNNTKTCYYNIFDRSFPAFLVESFVRNSEFEPVDQFQATHQFDELHRLFYFPILSDSLSSLGAARRHQWYSLFSTPVTVLGGDAKIFGLTSSYPSNFEENLSVFDTAWSFISSASCQFTLPEQGENLNISINLTNADTYLFTSTLEPNLMLNSRFFAAFFKRMDGVAGDVYRFDRWIAFADTINRTPSPGETLRKTYTTSLSNLDLSDLGQNYRFYYWLQATNGGMILFSSYQDFNSFLSNEDNNTPALRNSIYPNPLRRAGNLTVDLDTKLQSWEISVFNIRGQKLFSSRGTAPTYELPNDVLQYRGIYLIRIEGRDQRGDCWSEIRKISIIQ